MANSNDEEVSEAPPKHDNNNIHNDNNNANDNGSSKINAENSPVELSASEQPTQSESPAILTPLPTMIIVEEKVSRPDSPNSTASSTNACHDASAARDAFLARAASAQSRWVGGGRETENSADNDHDDGNDEEEEVEDHMLPDADFQSNLSVSEYQDAFRGETIVDYLPIPPDGGYGWVIVGASFASNVIVDGIANSFGPFMVAYQTSFESSKAATSFIGSLLVGTYLLAGPLAGGLLNKFEACRVVIAGALLSAAAFVSATFSPNVVTHCIFYGIFGGTGFAFIYLPAIVSVSQYFEKRRALATGISVAGSGVGTFVMPLLCKYLIETFNWRITLYILAAIILLCAICGTFYKPLPVPEDQLNEELVKQQQLLAALSRADFSDDDDEDHCFRSSQGSHEDQERDDYMPHAQQGSPFRRGTRQTNSQCTNRTSTRGADDGQPLLNSMERASSHDEDVSTPPAPARPSSSSATASDEPPVATTTTEPVSPPPGHATTATTAAATLRPTQLSPISEAAATGAQSRISRVGSQHHHTHSSFHSPAAPTASASVMDALPAAAGVTRMSSIVRNRKTTLTSMNSEFTSIANGIDLRNSRANLTGQLSRISARSYAQSLSRISQGRNSIKAGDSILSVALSGVDPKEFNRPMSRRDILLQGSIKNLKEFEDEGCNYKAYREQHSISIPAAVVAQSLSKLTGGMGATAPGAPSSLTGAAAIHGDIAELSSRMGGSRYSRITGGFATEEEELAAAFVDDSKFKWIPFPIRNVFAEMIDVNLLREPVMLLLCLSNMLGMVGFYVPFVFIMDLAMEKSVDASRATLLLSIIGITNTFGRVLFGWMADRQWVSALVLNNMSLIICGLLTIVCPIAPDFFWLSVYAALFGFVISAYICLTSIVLSDLLGVERLTNSFGLLVVSRGVASLIGTPMAGIVYDATHSYNASFYSSGSLIVLAGVVSCLISIVHRHERSKFKNEGDYYQSRILRAGGASGADPDVEAQSGKLSVLTERSEENLTEYQRTIQSLAQQKQLIRELDEYKAAVRRSKGVATPLGNNNSNNSNGNNCNSSDESNGSIETNGTNGNGVRDGPTAKRPTIINNANGSSSKQSGRKSIDRAVDTTSPRVSPDKVNQPNNSNSFIEQRADKPQRRGAPQPASQVAVH